jgi:hypothetical protein
MRTDKSVEQNAAGENPGCWKGPITGKGMEWGWGRDVAGILQVTRKDTIVSGRKITDGQRRKCMQAVGGEEGNWTWVRRRKALSQRRSPRVGHLNVTTSHLNTLRPARLSIPSLQLLPTSAQL